MKNRNYAIVTGASRGIGKAIAAALANEGWNLILTCRASLTMLQDFSRQLEEQYGINVLPRACDAGCSAAVRALFEELEVRSITPSLLINNAGIAHIGLLQDMTDEEWNALIQTNLSSVFYTSRAIIPFFLKAASAASLEQEGCGGAAPDEAPGSLHELDSHDSPADCRGRIINISSVWGLAGASCEVAYSATKGGVNAFSKALAKELAPSGIPVNAIACGCIDTEMNGHLSEEEKEELAEEIPAGRFADPKEVAKAVLQLVHMPPYLTGQIITLDGGWL